MHRFWNLKTQFVAVLVALLLAALVLQNYVHELNKDRLLVKVESTAQRIADEVTRRLSSSVGQDFAVATLQGGGRNTQRSQRLRPGMIRLMLPRVMFENEVRRLATQQKSLHRASLHFLLAFNDELNPTAIQEFGSHNPLPVSPAAEIVLRRPEHPPVVLARTDGEPEAAVSERNLTGSIEAVRSESSDALMPNSSTLPFTVDEPGTTDIDITEYLDEVQGVFDEYRHIDLLATIGIFICGIAAALYLSFRITRPVYEVVDAFERVAGGHLETRVDEDNPGEFAVLATQFNRMVESIEENRQLERELAQRERVLHMGDLAAGVAHDVRNPLNAIHLNIGQIRDEFLPEDETSRERFLRFTSDVQREVVRLNQLVSNFLSLAQPSASSPELVDPNELLRELVRLLRTEAADRHVELDIDLEADLPALGWDRQEMTSAFLNIAMNALQAMEPEGGSLSIMSGVRASESTADPDSVALTFVDTGKGIAPEDFERIFVPYYTTRHGGTGLGMAIARRITERNGGRLELQSRVGEGTSVTFLFMVGPDSSPGETSAANGVIS